MINNDYSELIHLKGNTYYIKGFTNLGLYMLNDKDCILIDCPFKKDGPKIYELLKKHNLNLVYIVNTHSHPDHTGSNEYLIKQTGCKVIASRIERAFLRNNKLDIGFLSGGYPLDNYDTPLMHVDDQHDILSFRHLPSELRSFRLAGHHYDMRGIKTKDNVYFIADSICTKELIDKENIMLIYDVEGYKNSLNHLKKLKGNIMVPAHCPVSKDFDELVDYNLAKMNEIESVILNILDSDKTYDDIIQGVFNHYNIRITYNKYLLMGSTIRSYLSYLTHLKMLYTYFKDNKLYFTKNKQK